jgi:hypothetical protein
LSLQPQGVAVPNLVSAIVFYFAGHRLFKPVGIKKDEIKQAFLSETVVFQQRS